DSMPWSGDTYTFEPWVPVENFLNSLEATPNPDGFEVPTFTQLAQALQAVAAGGILDFAPISPGCPFCPATCSFLPDSANYPALVQDISNLMPGNPIINEWLTAFNDPTGGPGISYNNPVRAAMPVGRPPARRWMASTRAS